MASGVEVNYYATTFVINMGVSLLALGMFIYAVAAIVPTLSITVRRLHDAGLSAWWMLLLIPMAIPGVSFVAGIIMLVFTLLPTKVNDNPYQKNNL